MMTLIIFTIENDKIINIIYNVMRLKLNNYVKLPRIVNGIQGNISLVSFVNRSMKIFTKTSIQYSMKTLVESRRHSVTCCSSEHNGSSLSLFAVKNYILLMQDSICLSRFTEVCLSFPFPRIKIKGWIEG